MIVKKVYDDLRGVCGHNAESLSRRSSIVEEFWQNHGTISCRFAGYHIKLGLIGVLYLSYCVSYA